MFIFLIGSHKIFIGTVRRKKMRVLQTPILLYFTFLHITPVSFVSVIQKLYCIPAPARDSNTFPLLCAGQAPV